jgi:hypothetical protein
MTFFQTTTDISRSTRSEARAKISKKFFWDFRVELQKTLDILEETLQSEIPRDFVLDSIIAGHNELKIRIADEEKGLYRLVSVILRYHHDDEKYGNVHIEIIASEVSTKTKNQFLGKYLITDQKSIKKDVLQAVLRHIRAIY